MTDLETLNAQAATAEAAFDAACKPYYCDGRWGAYRAIECDQEVPATVWAALDAYHAATHAYYLARDGHLGL